MKGFMLTADEARVFCQLVFSSLPVVKCFSFDAIKPLATATRRSAAKKKKL
jgi:hypothetical protein